MDVFVISNRLDYVVPEMQLSRTMAQSTTSAHVQYPELCPVLEIILQETHFLVLFYVCVDVQVQADQQSVFPKVVCVVGVCAGALGTVAGIFLIMKANSHCS